MALAVSAVMYAATYRGMYADGALYLLNIVTSGDFLHVSRTRMSATFLTQAPLVLSLRLGMDSLRMLAGIHTLSLVLVPLTAYIAALWIARRSPVLFCGTVVMITSVFYPTSFVLIGEFQVLYALYWLAFVMLLSSTADRLAGACMLPVLGLALMLSYEVSALLCAILAVLSAWRALTSADRPAKQILLISACLFCLGSWLGLQGLLYPRDLGNTRDFITALQHGHGNQPLIELTTLAILACAGAFLPDIRYRRIAAVTLTALALLFVVIASAPSRRLGLGAAFAARAQVLPILLGVSVMCLLLPRRHVFRAWGQPWLLIVPVLAAFIVDAGDTLGWHRFVGSMCRELANRHLGNADLRFARSMTATRYGWDWTYPTMSVLLRPLDSTAIITDPDYRGWQPGDTLARASAVAAFKRHGALCAESASGS